MQVLFESLWYILVTTKALNPRLGWLIDSYMKFLVQKTSLIFFSAHQMCFGVILEFASCTEIPDCRWNTNPGFFKLVYRKLLPKHLN